MSVSMQSLGIDQLSLVEQLELVEAIWDNIASQAESLEIPQSHKDELARRDVAFDANPKAGSSWEEVDRRLSERFGESL